MRKFVKLASVACAAAMMVSATAMAAEEEFLIGSIGPLTGDVASYGISVKQGAEIAVAEINKAGGVTIGDTTYKFAMDSQDDQGSEDIAVQAYNTVMDDGANVIMGAVTSAPCIAITSYTYADGILQITPSGSAEDCIANDNAFRICFSDPEQGVAMADYLFDTVGISKVAVIYDTASDYSTGIKDAFEAEFADKGGEVVTSEAFQTNDEDFNTQLTSIQSTDAEAIYVPAYYQDAGHITKQAAEKGMDLPFFGSDGWDGVQNQVADPALVEGCIYTSPFCAAADDPKTAAFVEAYEAAYGSTPDQFAADGYDCVYTYKAAMEQAQSIENEDLIAAMTEITVEGLTGTMTFDASGAPIKDVLIVTIKDGVPQYI